MAFTSHRSNTSNNFETRTAMYHGRKHIIAPVVLMVEGVHCGSGGPTLYTAEELSKFPEAWNGRPVPVKHPEDENGIPVTCNDPQTIQKYSVGHLFNVFFDEDERKLKGEIWVDEQRAGIISPVVLRYLLNGEQLEVSTGVYTEDEFVSGVYQGEEYDKIARNLRPDHLALLPGERGACSWEDGCGVRANAEGGVVLKRTKLPKKVVEALTEHNKKLKDMIREGLFVYQKEGYGELMSKIQAKLDALDSDSSIHFLEEVYDNSFVYRVSNFTSDSSQLYKRNYSVGEDGSVEFDENATEVLRRVEYVETAKQNVENNTNVNKEGETDMGKQKIIDGLIANKATKFEEDDREWLDTLSECALGKLVPVEPEVNEPKIEEPKANNEPKVEELKVEEPKINKEDALAVLKETITDQEQFLALLPKDLQDEMRSGLRLHQEKRAGLIDRITANSDVFTKEELESRDTEELEKLAKFVKPKANYSGMGGVTANVTLADDELLLPPDVKFE